MGGVIFKKSIMANDPQDPKGPQNGNPDGNQNGNPDPNVVALQQKLSEKDVEMKKLEKELADLKTQGGAPSETALQIAEMNKTISTLSENLQTLQSEKERDVLVKEYPDIVPELLIGKTKDEQKRLVEAQRAKTQAQYESAPSAHTPRFTDRASVENEIESVRKNIKLSTEEKLQKIRELKNELDEF